MDYKISDSEWKVMEILWEKGTATQSEVMDALTEGWNKNTVYTFLSRLSIRDWWRQRAVRSGMRQSSGARNVSDRRRKAF